LNETHYFCAEIQESEKDEAILRIYIMYLLSIITGTTRYASMG